MVQYSPVWMPAKRFDRLDVLIRQLIWTHKNPSINFKILHKSKEEGGLAIPNFRLYFLSEQFSYFLGLGLHTCTAREGGRAFLRIARVEGTTCISKETGHAEVL